MTRFEKLFIVLLCMFLPLGGGLAALQAYDSRGKPPPNIEERELVLECMQEVGWEMSDEDADTKVQIEQSRAWCERFVSGE